MVNVLGPGLILAIGFYSAFAQQSTTGEVITEAHSSSPAAASVSSSHPAPPQRETIVFGGLRLKNTIEFGTRWRDFDGNEDVYRSHVNLGNGVKLLSSSFELRAPESGGRLFDSVNLNLDHWGGDPYNTARLRVKKNLWYDFQYHYQKIDSFNSIPQFANPLFTEAVRRKIGARQASGTVLGQHSFDLSRRLQSARLDLFPHAPRLQVHLRYARNSISGPAFITVNMGGDEFLINRRVKNSTNDYAFGVDLSLWKVTIGFEQGFRRFKDDRGNTLPGTFSLGNSPDLLFDFQQIFLTAFRRFYFVRGSIPTTRLAVSSRRLRRLAFTARLYYSDADVDYAYARVFSGMVLNRETFLFASRGLGANRAKPRRPHLIADGTMRLRLGRRFAVSETFRGTHFVIAGATTFGEQFTNFDAPEEQVTVEQASFRREFLNAFMNRVQGDYALTDRLIVRAGYRFEHRRTFLQERDRQSIRSSIFGPEPPFDFEPRDEETTQNTHTLFAGLSYRWRRRLRLSFDYENGGHLTSFTRVEPRDYQRGRMRIQFRPSDRWSFTASGTISDQTRPNRTRQGLDLMLRNQNRYRSGSISISWFPQRRAALDVDYTRSHITATIHTLDRDLGNAPRPVLVYREDSHVVRAGVNVILYKNLRTDFGYRLVNTSGSFPINFHRPYARLSLPVHRTMTLNIDYQHYGYNERGRSIQDYRANLLTTSLRLSF
ncbi:MAG: hypothetical protein D6723_12055 [Acidobacteria bacterium]|nr:MAG: hypothetical protein D6723_12055 [Acidobacteriota bacterium]